eukprot:Em0422g2a
MNSKWSEAGPVKQTKPDLNVGSLPYPADRVELMANTGPKDYGAVSEVRVFTEGSVEGQSLCVTVTTVDDSVVEGIETFQITLSANSPNVTIGDRAGGVAFTVNVNDNDENKEDFTIILGGRYRTVVTSSNNTVHVTIIDNDIALIGLRNGNPTTTPETDTMLSVCIALTNAAILDIPINVDFEAISGTATKGKDFIQVESGNFVFTPGNTIACIHINILQDSILEYNEYILFSTSCNNSHAVCSAGSGSIQIIEDGDTVTIGFDVESFNGTEGSSDPLKICAVMMEGSLERLIPVYVTTHAPGATATDITIGFASGAPSIVTEGLNLTLKLCPEILNGSLEKDVTVFATTMDITATSPSDYGYEYVELKFSYGQRVGDKVCFFIGINNDVNVLEYTEQFEVSLTQCCKDIYFPPQQGSILVTILEEPADDYVPLNSTITFIYGMSSGSTICTYATIIDDDVVEEDVENFNLSIIATEPPVTTISLSLSTISIQERNNDAVEIGLNQRRYVGTEGGSVIVCAKIFNGYIERTVSVYLSAYSGTANEGTDFIGVSRVVLKMPMYSSVNDTICTDIMITNDTDIEPEEQFTITLETVDPAVNITFKTGIVLILIDSHDVAIFEMKLKTVTVTEGRNSSFPICASLKSLSGTLTTSVSVGLVTNDISSFVHEPVEEFLVFLDKVAADSSVVDFSEGFSNATVHIHNADYVFQFVNTSYVQLEGSPVIICLQIIKYPQNDQVQTIPVILSTRSVSATGGQDYDDSMHVILFRTELLNGTMTECTAIQIIDDHAIEGDETFEVNLIFLYSSSTSVTNRNSAVVTIRQSSNNYAVGMFVDNALTGVAGEDIKVCVLLEDATGDIKRTLNVSVSTINETAFRGEDYELLGPETLSFSPGSTIGSTECLTVQLVNKISANVISFVLQLTSDDPALKILKEFAMLSIRILHTLLPVSGVSMTAKLAVAKEELRVAELCAIIKRGTIAHDTVFPVFVLGTTATGYSVPRSFEFAVGMAENSLQCIDVTIHDDEFVEDDEELVLKIESLDPNAFVTIVQDYSITTLYIKEDSNDFIEIHWVKENYAAQESEDVELCAQIGGGALRKDVVVTVNVSLNTVISIEWSERVYNAVEEDTNVLICASIINGTLETNVTVPFTYSQGTVATFSLVENRFMSTEGVNSTVLMCILLSIGSLEKTVTMSMENEGTSVMDYKVDGPIVFLPGSSDNDKSTECFIVNIIDDDIVEGTEVFILNLTVNSSGCRIVGDPSSSGEVELTIIDDPTDVSGEAEVNLTIIEDPADVVTLFLQSSNYYIREASSSDNLEVCGVIQKGSLERDVSVAIVATNGTAIYGADYTLESTDLTFTSGQNQSYNTMQCKTITIHVIDDSILEYNESFSLSIVAAHPAIPGATNEITVVIKEDPSDFVEIGLAQLLYEVDQDFVSVPLQIDVEMVSGNLQRNVSLTISLASKPTTSIATLGVNALFMNTTTFTYGESSGAVHQEMLNISSIHGNEFASVILQPIPKDRDVIRIANAQAFIKISVHTPHLLKSPSQQSRATTMDYIAVEELI